MSAEHGAAEDEGLGLLIVGLGGAVASTVAAGLQRIKDGDPDRTGLPLARFEQPDLAPYPAIAVAGWDLNPADLATAIQTHRVLPPELARSVGPAMSAITPWRATGNTRFCRNIDGANRVATNSLLGAVEQIRTDIAGFRARTGIRRLVMLNLASVEAWPEDVSVLADPDRFERALADNHTSISPAMLYAYAAIREGVPYGNFTPSLGADIPALTALARDRTVPVAGKDGKTGQTLLKTVVAPMFRDRALHVDGWFSTNILGNQDGFALDDPDSRRSKIVTKAGVIDDILGYKVEDHVVHIHYYPPRGDDKEAWDAVDFTGFLGQRMQMKINLLCKDSVLAAPIAIEVARSLDLARGRGQGGVQHQLGLFFKSPMTVPGRAPEHDFFRQQRAFEDWLLS